MTPRSLLERKHPPKRASEVASGLQRQNKVFLIIKPCAGRGVAPMDGFPFKSFTKSAHHQQHIRGLRTPIEPGANSQLVCRRGKGFAALKQGSCLESPMRNRHREIYRDER